LQKSHYIGLFCRKWPMKIRHPISPRHPVPLAISHISSWHIRSYLPKTPSEETWRKRSDYWGNLLNVDISRVYTMCIRKWVHCSPLQPTATHCNPLQPNATHCNTLQHLVMTLVCISELQCVVVFDMQIGLFYMDPFDIDIGFVYKNTHRPQASCKRPSQASKMVATLCQWVYTRDERVLPLPRESKMVALGWLCWTRCCRLAKLR